MRLERVIIVVGTIDVGFFLFYSNNFKKYLDEFNKKNIRGKNTKEKIFFLL